MTRNQRAIDHSDFILMPCRHTTELWLACAMSVRPDTIRSRLGASLTQVWVRPRNIIFSDTDFDSVPKRREKGLHYRGVFDLHRDNPNSPFETESLQSS